MTKTIILKDMEPDDFILGVRAAKYLIGQFKKDAVVSYDDGGKLKDFYVKRNKSRITVRPCEWR